MSPPETANAPKPMRLLDQVRDKLRKLHYSPRTEEAYVGWIKRYIWFHGKRHPKEMGEAEVEAFLSSLATQRGVSASTQNQARSVCSCASRTSISGIGRLRFTTARGARTASCRCRRP